MSSFKKILLPSILILFLGCSYENTQLKKKSAEFNLFALAIAPTEDINNELPIIDVSGTIFDYLYKNTSSKLIRKGAVNDFLKKNNINIFQLRGIKIRNRISFFTGSDYILLNKIEKKIYTTEKSEGKLAEIVCTITISGEIIDIKNDKVMAKAEGTGNFRRVKMLTRFPYYLEITPVKQKIISETANAAALNMVKRLIRE